MTLYNKELKGKTTSHSSLYKHTTDRKGFYTILNKCINIK